MNKTKHRLWWRLPFISTCLEHGILLERRQLANDEKRRRSSRKRGILAPRLLLDLDRKTLIGLSRGIVPHARRTVPIDRWLQLMRAMISELRDHQYIVGWYDLGIVDGIWMRANVAKPRRGPRPAQFESLEFGKQVEMMVAVSEAIDLLDRGLLRPDGVQAVELVPTGTPLGDQPRENFVEAAKTAIEEIKSAIYGGAKPYSEISRLKRNPSLWYVFRNYLRDLEVREGCKTQEIWLPLDPAKLPPEKPLTMRWGGPRVRKKRWDAGIKRKDSYWRYPEPK